MPWLSVTIWSTTAESMGPWTLLSSSARASSSVNPCTAQLGQPGQDVVARPGAGGAHQRDRLGQQSSRDEGQHLG